MARQRHGTDIVIIEDDPTITGLLVDLLGLEGYRVVTFADGSDLEAVADAGPRLILLDLMMAPVDGAEICRRLRADPRTRTTPIVFMTAAARLMVSQRLQGCAYDALVHKPFDIDQMLVIAARYVRERPMNPVPDHVALGHCPT